ncbi:hypothetical protein K474DRAFT_1568459, partial [Panus rudis PR-1116 ss-1]
MHHTPWTKKSSHLPSDRLPPKPAQAGPGGKGKAKQNERPKSKEVQKLEELRNGLKNNTNGIDPSGGCFCLARVHTLSPYTPGCRSCGLILCSVNKPGYDCPHCRTPLITGAARESLIARIEEEIHETLLKEEQERERAVEEARQAAGAFPALAPSSSTSTPLHAAAAASHPGSLQHHPVNQSHKVLSLNSKTRKIKVSSYNAAPPMNTAAISKGTVATTEPKEKIPPKVPPPPREVPVASGPPNPERPWARLDGEVATYVPPLR